MFKKLKNQIANQTRPELGSVLVNHTKGYNFIKKKVVATDIPNDKPIEFQKWKKSFYFLNRAGNVFTVPVLDNEIFYQQYPGYLKTRDYYRLTDVFNSPDYNVYHDDVEVTQDNGSFVVTNLLSLENAMYEYAIMGNGSEESFSLRLGSNHISVSVWATIYRTFTSEETAVNQSQNGLTYETVLLYQSGVNGLVDSWADVHVPIGSLATKIFILTYNHADNPIVTLCGKKECYPSKIGDGLGSVPSDTFLNVEMHRYESSVNSAPNLAKYIPPQWKETNPIESSADPNTGNIINTLSFKNSNFFDNENKIQIFRREIFDDLSIETTIDSRLQPNLIVLSTSDIDGFDGNIVFKVNNKYNRSLGAMLSKANTINNSNFENFTLNRPDNWTYNSTATGTIWVGHSTVYPYYGDSKFGGSSLRMKSQYTSTTKSQYVETGYLLSNTADSIPNGYFSFYYRHESGLRTAKVKSIFYTSSDGTLSSLKSSASVFVRANSYEVPLEIQGKGWQQAIINASTFPMDAPNDSKYVKFRIYNSYGDTSASSYLIDGVHYGEMNSYHTYHTSLADKVVLQLSDNFTKARNSDTIVNSWFQSTTESITNSLCASSVYGKLYYIDNTAWGTAVGFDRAVGIFDSSRSYHGNLNFSGGMHLWATANGLSLETVSGKTLFNNSYYMRFNNDGDTSTGLLFNVDAAVDPTNGFNSTWWLKSRLSGQKIKIQNVYYTGERVDSATFNLTNEWKQYSLKSDFSTSLNFAYSRISIPKNSQEFDVCGYMTTRNDYNEFINYLDTSANGASGILSDRQGIKYSTSLNSSYGTIRMWYTPTLDESTGRPYNSLFFWGNSTNYKSLFYNKYNQSFVFRQKSGSNYKTCEIATATGSNSAIHIVATWDTAESLLYINNKKSLATATYTNVTSTSFNVGYGAPSLSTPYCANGFISNFRAEESTWNFLDVSKDYSATHLTYLDGSTVEAYAETFIGEKTIGGNDKYFKFIDDVGLEPNTTYHYVFKIADDNNNTTILSTPQSVTTKRKPFEQTSVNKVRNSSFEVGKGANNQPLYWSTGNTNLTLCNVSTDYYFANTRSIEMWGGGGNYPTYEQNYIVINDTTLPLALSWYSHSPTIYPVDRVTIGWYDNNITLISTISGYGKSGNLDSSVSQVGLDGNTWTRYSTIFPLSSASYKSARYMSLSFNNNSPAVGYLDAVQAEHNSIVTPYKESPFIQDGNLGPNAVDGNAISFDSLVGKHFQSSEIVVNSPDSDASKLTVGYATAGSNFIRFTPNRAVYHQAGTSTTEGFHFSKHVESGVAFFDTTIVFNAPFQIWNSTSQNQLTPHYFVVPKKYKTYDSAYPNNHQELSIVVTFDSAASSMYVNAYLQNGQGYMTQDLDDFRIDNGATWTTTITSESGEAADTPLY